LPGRDSAGTPDRTSVSSPRRQYTYRSGAPPARGR